MAVRVLGPLDTGNEHVLSPRERVVLAALIVRAGRTIAPGELAEACWGDDPPRTWTQQVKTSVARIRAGLGRAAVVTRGSEYTLGLDPATIDAFEFERLVSRARQHALHDEHDRAIDAYRRAVALWRGDAYVELADWEPAAVEAERLAEIRDSAQEELLEARLAEGEHRGVVADAERLVREAPLREDRWAILAIAQYRAGRQAEALATVRAARGRLADDLGIDVGDRLRELETSMLQQDPTLAPIRTPHRVSEACPYHGLAAFSPSDADEFFGREADVDALCERVRAGTLTAVVGASGSGKSSLVLAGLLPRVSDGRRVAVVTAGRDAALDLRTRVEHRGAADIVVIDQAETVFQLPEAERDALCAIVADVLDAGSAVILTLRSDFLDRATGLIRLGALIGRGVYAIGPLSADGLRQAIEAPAARAGLRLEPGLVELIVRDAGDRRTTLPHVSHALVETWVRREGAALTVAAYESAGGIAGAIAQSAETLYRSLGQDEATACRALLMRLVQRGPDGASVRRIARLEPLLADTDRRRVLDRLVSMRLLTVDADTVVVAHEAVAEAWPRLDGWLEEDAENARLVASVANAAEVWNADGRREDDLLRGARLRAALEWDDATRPDLTDLEHAFLEASSAREQSEVQALAAHAAREARTNRRLRWALSGVGVLLAVALVSGTIALVRGREVAAAAQEALIEAVTNRALGLVDTDRQVAALMAVAAWRRWPEDARTRSALFGTMTAADGYVANTFIPGATERIAAAPIPTTGELAVIREYYSLEIHDADSGALLRTLSTDFPRTGQEVRPWIRVSADGSTIAIMQHTDESAPPPGQADADPDVQRDELIHFFDVKTGDRVGAPIAVPEWGETIELSSDGRYLTWASAGPVVVVDRDSGAVVRAAATRPGLTAGVLTPSYAASAFRPDGRIVATNIDDLAFVIDPATGDVIASGAVPEGSGGTGVAVAADGVTVTTGRENVIAGLSPDGEPLWRVAPDRGEECGRLAASAVHQLVVCGSEGHTVTFRSLDDGTIVRDTLDYQAGAPGEPVLSPDEREVWFMSAVAPSIGRLRIDGSGPASTSVGGLDDFADTDVDPSGRYIVLASRVQWTSGADLDRRVWDVESGRPVADLATLHERDPGVLPARIDHVGWVDDGLLLVDFADHDGSDHIRFYDVPTGELRDPGLPDGTVDFIRTRAVLYAVVAGDDGIGLRPSDPETFQPTGDVIALPGEPWSIETTADGSRLVVTVWSERQRPWHTIVYDAEGAPRADGLGNARRTALTPDGTILSGEVSGLIEYSLDLAQVGSLPSGINGDADLVLSEDGRTLLLNGWRSGVQLVDLPSREPLGELIDSFGPTGAWVEPDGDGFVISGERGAQLWTLDPVAHAHAACRIAGRELTAAEWDSFLAELGPRHPVCATD